MHDLVEAEALDRRKVNQVVFERDNSLDKHDLVSVLTDLHRLRMGAYEVQPLTNLEDGDEAA